MTPFPLPLGDILGHWGSYIIYLFIGLAFGFVLEVAGFGNSKKLAAQFYFKDMTVLKVMFGAIVTAMLLIFLSTSMGLLDYNLVWVNPTYLVPGVVGGLLMGVGFIVGGFCPGTSLVAAATLKLDGVFFVLGVFFGIFMFGETVGFYDTFWESTYMGRFTLMDLFNVSTGVVVLAVVLMALFMFWGAEQLERIFGDADPSQAPRWRFPVAAGLVVLAGVVLLIGQPTTEDRWAKIAPERAPLLEERAYQIHPGELMELRGDRSLNTIVLDVREQSDFNVFHILDSRHVPLANIPDIVAELHTEPANTVFVLVSNDETAATEAWRILVSESVPNVYILGGGINEWIATFAEEDFIVDSAVPSPLPETLGYVFTSAIGSRHPLANPNPDILPPYESKVVMETKRAPTSGGCG